MIHMAERAGAAGKQKVVAFEQAEDLATVSNAPAEEPVRTLEKALGLQVRVLRRERDLSVVDLAAASGISSGMMSKIENGQISPSLSTVQAIAGALNVPFTSLFQAFEEKRDCSYVPSGRGVVIERRGTKVGHVYELLGAVLGGDLVVEPYLITLKDDAEPYTGLPSAPRRRPAVRLRRAARSGASRQCPDDLSFHHNLSAREPLTAFLRGKSSSP